MVWVGALTAHEARGYRHQQLDDGATGFVPKRAANDELVRSLRCAAAGEMFNGPAVT